MASRFKPYRQGLLPESVVCDQRVRTSCRRITNVSSIRNCFASSLRHVGSGGPVASHRGQRAYAPRQIVSILIYAYSRGIVVLARRQIEQRCREDLGLRCTSRGGTARTSGQLERFPEGPRGNSSGLASITCNGAVWRWRWRLVSLGHVSLDGSKFSGEQLEAQGDELRAAEGEGAGIVRGDRRP